MTGADRRRAPAFYRLVLALPAAVLAYLIASGRAAAYWRLFGNAMAGRPPSDAAFVAACVTAPLWIAATGPLLYAAWEIGRAHTAARRRHAAVLVGLREVVRRALGGTSAASAAADARRAAAFTRAPRDNPRVALAWAAVAGVGVPVFFASFAGPLRTPGALLWLVGTGALMAANVYCGHRAAAYLRDEPSPWDVFGQWKRLDPARYHAPARPLVRRQRVLAILIPLWWLGGGAAVLAAR